MADNRKYYITQLKNEQSKLNKTDFMIAKICEAQLLVKHGLLEQSKLDELEQKYLSAIQDKEVLRERVRKIETDLQEEIQKYDESLKEGNK